MWNMLKSGTQFYIKLCEVYLLMVIIILGSVLKNLSEAGDADSIPGLGRSPEGNGNPLQYFCLENPMDSGPCVLQFMGSQKVRHDLVTNQQHDYPHYSISILFIFSFSPFQNSL